MKFAPTAFVNPYEYLDTEETKNDVDRYELYMLGKTNPTYPDFKVSIRGICYYGPFYIFRIGGGGAMLSICDYPYQT